MAQAHPDTRELTLLLTDVESSSSLWERDAEAMNHALERHDELVAAAVGSRGGAVIKSRGEGDSSFAVFDRPDDAAAASLKLQLSLAAGAWEIATPLRVRVALHTTVAHVRDGDYYGQGVNRCARLRALAHGGQIIMSEATASLVRDRLPEGAGLKDLGLHRLRDLSRPERVFQLLHSSLRVEFPPLKSVEAFANNLPVQITTFVGRERQIAEIKKLLPSNRLVTLTGSGGCGKTRLALQVAAEVLEAFPDGVWFVDLSPISSPSLVPATVAAVIGIREELGLTLLDTLADYLRSRKVLIVLDGCEHLVSTSAELAEHLLLRAAELSVIATSREALGLRGEKVWRVPSMLVPEVSSETGSLTKYESVALFVERARLVNPGFQLTEDNAASIAAICRRVDGIPLAIELAAAKVKLLSVSQIEERLDHRFELLTGGSRTALPRQRTLRAMVDWSYDLLSEAEMTLFRRVSIFLGGFTLDAVERVSRWDGLNSANLLELLSQLLDKSLIMSEERSRKARYWMLETIREYASEKLQEAEEQEETQKRHLGFFLEIVEKAEPELLGPNQRLWLDVLQSEHDNLRRAIAWALRVDEESALHMVGALWRFWYIRGFIGEGRGWLSQALETAAGCSDEAKSLGLHGAGTLAWTQGDYDAAYRLLQLALEIRRKLGDKQRIAETLNNLGNVAGYQGNYEQARVYLDESLTIARELGYQSSVARSLNNLGYVARLQSEFGAAKKLLQEARSILIELGDKRSLAVTLANLGNISLHQGDYAGARSVFNECLAIGKELGFNEAVALALTNLGNLARIQGDYPAARSLLEQAVSIRRELGDRWGATESLDLLSSAVLLGGDTATALSLVQEMSSMARQLGNRIGMAWSLRRLAEIARREGDLDRADSLFSEALESFRTLGDKLGQSEALEALASVAVAQGDTARGRRLYTDGETLRREIGAPLPPYALPSYEEDLATIRRLLGA